MKTRHGTLIYFLFCGFSLFGSLNFENQQISMHPEIGVEKVEGLFKFVNTSDQSVVILSTKSSCGCTAAVLDKQVYAPGEEGVIKAVFTIGQRKGMQNKTITVVTDEKPSSQYRLSLSVDIPVSLSLEPSLLQWSKDESPISKSATVEVGDPEKFKIVGIGEVPDTFKLKLDIHSDGSATIEATPVGEVVRRVERVSVTAESEDGKTFTETLYLLRR